MTNHESYVFTVCLVVFTLFVILFTAMIGSIVRLNLRLIKNGVEDERIEREFNRKNYAFFRFTAKLWRAVSTLLSLILTLIFLAAFLLALYSNQGADKKADEIPMIKVVMSESMSEKYYLNKYLYDNALDNQLEVYDLVVIRELPPEEELKLYDVVVYEIDGELIIHRIVGIEEPNEKHGERHFLLQGDAMAVHDKFPVLYEQMRGIYEGEKVSNIGSFFVFMRSPGGYLCIFLVLAATIIAPILEWVIGRARKKRWYGF